MAQVLAYTGNADGKKYLLDGEVTLDKIKVSMTILYVLNSIALDHSVSLESTC